MKKLLLFIILIATLVVAGCAESSDSHSDKAADTPADTPTDTVSSNYVTQDAVDEEDSYDDDPTLYSCNWDWKLYLVRTIDYSTAPSGYVFAVCDVYIQNNDTKTISTNPWNWALVADGVAYDHDPVTYSDTISHNTVDIGLHGEFETHFVFLVKDTIQTGSLLYTGYNSPDMNRIHYYKSSDEIASEKAQEIQTTAQSFLDDLVAEGHDLSGFKMEETEIDNEEQSATIFVTDDISEVKYIFELGLEAYQLFTPTDVYVVRVDGRDYWTPMDDIRKYKAQDLRYESSIYVYFPTGQKVTLEKLPHKID